MMYLRTPKRYRRSRRELRLFSARTIRRLVLLVLLVVAGWLLWNHRVRVREVVQPEIERAANTVQTQVAPAPTPTATPDLSLAQAGCNIYQQRWMADTFEQCLVLAASDPNNVLLHYHIAHMLITTSNSGRNTQRLDEALLFAEKTINADPEAPHGWAIRAMALDWQGNIEEALASALQAKALDNSFAPTYTFLGEIYLDLGQYERVEELLVQALDFDTGGIAVADTFRTRGLLYSTQGYYEDALQPYQSALQNAPDHAYIAVELANNYLALRQNEKAILVLIASLERDETNPQILFALGNAHTRNGNNERAIEYYSRCLDTDRDNVPCLSFLGGLRWSDGDFATAIVNLERAITLGSTDPDDFYQLGHSYSSMGRCDQATPYLQQGYQIVLDRNDVQDQAAFVDALQTCGVLITPPPETSDTP